MMQDNKIKDNIIKKQLEVYQKWFTNTKRMMLANVHEIHCLQVL